MKRYSISKPRKYTDNQGSEKTYWDKVGEMLEWEKQDGSISRVIKIPAIGLEANIFEEKPRENAPTRTAPAKPKAPTKPEPAAVDYPEEEINAEDIPF